MLNDWTRRFGKIRAAKDKAILQEAERTIAKEAKDGFSPSWASHPPVKDERPASDQRDAIARAFGRPKDVWQ
jgi:hypothetical protein